MRRLLPAFGAFLARKGRRLRPAQLIVLTFAALVLLGAVLLQLPAASRSGVRCSFLDALFTATSATCVTGLAVGDTYTLWSGFGQAVILCLIQLGGLGFMTAAAAFSFLLKRRIGLRQRMILAQALSLNELEGAVRLVRHVLAGTILFEAAGVAVLTLRFSLQYPFLTALKWGVFHAVSAFCNAGFDLFGQLEPGSSLALFAGDWTVNMVLIVLISAGGLGFFVWEELLQKRSLRRLSVYARLVLLLSGALVVLGTVLFALLEWNNPETLGPMTPGKKLLAALFQSVTTRTAGFASVDQGALTDASKAVTMLLMFIGGSSGSTAGGVKTVTFGLLLAAAVAAARGRASVRLFRRTIRQEQIAQAMAIVILVLMLDMSCALVICVREGLPLLDVAYEVVSALGTAGLTTGITGSLHASSRVILIFLMFFGRVGIMTISLGFLSRKPEEERFQYADTQLMIG